MPCENFHVSLNTLLAALAHLRRDGLIRSGHGADGHEWIAETIKGHKSERNDIRSFADLLDFDDYLCYGGKA